MLPPLPRCRKVNLSQADEKQGLSVSLSGLLLLSPPQPATCAKLGESPQCKLHCPQFRGGRTTKPEACAGLLPSPPLESLACVEGLPRHEQSPPVCPTGCGCLPVRGLCQGTRGRRTIQTQVFHSFQQTTLRMTPSSFLQGQ